MGFEKPFQRNQPDPIEQAHEEALRDNALIKKKEGQLKKLDAKIGTPDIDPSGYMSEAATKAAEIQQDIDVLTGKFKNENDWAIHVKEMDKARTENREANS